MNKHMEMPSSWFFLGIGGAGMNPLARHLHQAGFRVAGYDSTPSSACQQLEALGIPITYDIERANELDSNWGVVFTPAVEVSHPVFEQALDLGLPVLKRAELLGQLSRTKRVVAVAGTHGKTSISAMLTHLLTATGMSVTAFIGGHSLNAEGHYRYGTSDWWVIEADEFDRSFHHLRPELAVLTSIDPDHLDIYGSEETLLEAFQQFVELIQPGGYLLQHESLRGRILTPYNVQAAFYGSAPANSIRFRKIGQQGWVQRFKWDSPRSTLESAELAVPGQHNLDNMAAALALAEEIWYRQEQKFPLALASEGIWTYRGVRRRWEVLVEKSDLVVVLDYAHHPEEIRAAIATARALFPKWQVEVVFQPHLYSRTQQLAAQFAQALSAADRLYLTHIYPAREEPISGVTCEIITPYLRQELPRSILNLNQVLDAVAAANTAPRILLVLGAGDIDQLAPDLIKRFS
jgi:UDP-N-acetylmuramate--alanine ligase